jgi:hypothetical protein
VYTLFVPLLHPPTYPQYPPASRQNLLVIYPKCILRNCVHKTTIIKASNFWVLTMFQILSISFTLFHYFMY